MNAKPILLIEDNPDDEELTIRALKKNNISNPVDVVRDGEQALDYLFRRGAYAGLENNLPPQLILLDLKIPKFDGLEVLKQIRQNPATKLLPVVILTSSKEEQDIINGYDSGANSYIRKPVSFADFTDAVHNLGLYWLILNECPPTQKQGVV